MNVIYPIRILAFWHILAILANLIMAFRQNYGISAEFWHFGILKPSAKIILDSANAIIFWIRLTSMIWITYQIYISAKKVLITGEHWTFTIIYYIVV